jgi:hypothetical protein
VVLATVALVMFQTHLFKKFGMNRVIKIRTPPNLGKCASIHRGFGMKMGALVWDACDFQPLLAFAAVLNPF